jgi:hypothetical protein
MKTTKVLSAVLAFVMLVIISGCSSETAVKTNSEDGIKESTKSNIEMTEPETTTEAITVLSTKDGITLENAPKLEDNTAKSPTYPVTINGENYTADPWSAVYYKEGSEETLDFDRFVVNTTKGINDGLLNGMYFTATIDGQNYGGETLAEQRALAQALSAKYPNFTFSYEKDADNKGFTLNLSGAEEMDVRIVEPSTERSSSVYFDLTLNISDINNSRVASTYPHTFVNINGIISNSHFVSYSQEPNNAVFDFSKFKNCKISSFLVREKVTSMALTTDGYSFALHGGENNLILLDLTNMTEGTNSKWVPVNITTGGMVASFMRINTYNSSFNLLEDAENPNINTDIECMLSTPNYTLDPSVPARDTETKVEALKAAYNEQIADDIFNGNLNYNFQTNDLDNTPVRFIAPGLGINTEIQTGGSLEKLPSDFLLNAPSDGSVYRLGE